MIRTLLYQLNRRAPVLFAPVRAVSGTAARLVHARAIRAALAGAGLSGTVNGLAAALRPLGRDDIEALAAFLEHEPPDRFSFFRPHGFDRPALHRHLGAGQFLSYGLFEDGGLVAYGLIRLTPGRTAFIGSMVAHSHGGRGIGKLMARYLYWQSARMGLDAHLTISPGNPASLRSHSPGRTLEKIQTLDEGGYVLFRAPRMPADDRPPELVYGGARTASGALYG